MSVAVPRPAAPRAAGSAGILKSAGQRVRATGPVRIPAGGGGDGQLGRGGGKQVYEVFGAAHACGPATS